jgi:integrase
MACIAKRRGRYVIDFYDTYGKRRWKTLPKGTTKKKANEALREIEDQLRKGIYIPDKKIPIFKEVANDWLDFKKSNVRKSTWEMYQGHIKHHFNDISKIRVNRITIASVEKFITTRQTQNMNLTSLRKIITTLNQVMNYAVRHKYIEHNPVKDAERPKDKGKIKKSNVRVLTPIEINDILNTVKDQKYRTLFKLAIMSGARQGELLGLKWSDIDWSTNQIHIQRTYNKGRWYRPKSKTSDRKIDLGPTMINGLKKWRLACPPSDQELVFPNLAGKPMCQSHMLSRHFRPALKTAGLEGIRFHDLRHTYASLLIDQGENIKYIQTQLGHSSPTLTLDVYAHLMKPVNQEAARRLEKAVFENNGSKTVGETNQGATY